MELQWHNSRSVQTKNDTVSYRFGEGRHVARGGQWGQCPSPNSKHCTNNFQGDQGFDA